jgi:hypothetical protein
VFEHDTDKNYQALSNFSNLLDGSSSTFWCTLPQGVVTLIGEPKQNTHGAFLWCILDVLSFILN